MPRPLRTIASASCLTTIVVLASGCGADEPAREAARRVPSGPTPQAVALRLAPPVQHDLLVRREMTVRLAARRPGVASVVAVLERPGEDDVAVSDPVPVTIGREARSVPLPLAGDADRYLAACERHALRVEVRVRGEIEPVADATTRVRIAPPRCGRFFAEDSVWNTELPPDVPLDPSSDRLVATLAAQVRANREAHYGPELNSDRFSSPVTVVQAGQKRVRVAIDQRGPHTRELGRAWSAVPLPDDAKPAEGTDRHLVVWQPATDTMWEFFNLRSEKGRWIATWGGRIRRASRSPGLFRPTRTGVKWGATATGLPLAAGLVTLADLERGRIDHALALALPEARRGVWSLPAQRTDGKAIGLDAIPEGARFRLDPTIDLDALRVPPLIRMLAEAAQRYGMIVRDQAGVVALYGEAPPDPDVDPFGDLLGAIDESEALALLPWDRLQLVRMDLRAESP